MSTTFTVPTNAQTTVIPLQNRWDAADFKPNPDLNPFVNAMMIENFHAQRDGAIHVFTCLIPETPLKTIQIKNRKTGETRSMPFAAVSGFADPRKGLIHFHQPTDGTYQPEYKEIDVIDPAIEEYQII